VAAPALNRHEIRSSRLAGGFHVRAVPGEPEMIEVLFLEPSAVLASDASRRDIEKSYTRQEYRRSSFSEMGTLSFPVRAMESYVEELAASVDREALTRRGFRCVVDYSFAAGSSVLPAVLGQAGVEVIGLNAFVEGSSASDGGARGSVERLVAAAGADLGVVFDTSGERIFLFDERGSRVPDDQALFLLIHLAVRRGLEGAVALPVTVSERAESLVEGSGIRILRTAHNRSELANAAMQPEVLFAGADAGGFAFGSFLPAFDATVSLVKVLELWAPIDEPLSAIVASLPSSTLVHEDVHCPWALKGIAMRLLIEEAKGMETENLDGLKVRENGGWVELLPDPDRPLFHIYAEGPDEEASLQLAERYRERLAGIMAEHGGE
jgi:mannose-1-phosphate guanylyltransferase/phosphomannomutase